MDYTICFNLLKLQIMLMVTTIIFKNLKYLLKNEVIKIIY